MSRRIRASPERTESSQIKSDDREPAKIAKPPLAPSSNLDNLLTDFDKPTTSKSLKNDSPVIDDILSQVKASYKQQDQEQSQLKQQQIQAEGRFEKKRERIPSGRLSDGAFEEREISY